MCVVTHFSSKRGIAAAAFVALSMYAGASYGQTTQTPGVGIPGDWTHHHVVFSSPDSAENAMREGRYEAWKRTTGDLRYRMQQVRQSMLERQLSAAPDYASRLAVMESWARNGEGGNGRENGHGKPQAGVEQLKTDWSMSLGKNTTVGAGQYPATFSYATSTPSCNDWVAYNTGVKGVSGGQANIAAYTNLYDTTCTAPNPTVSWAYYTGADYAYTSVVPSIDGGKVAFVSTASAASTAYLRILSWHAGQGTPSAAATPDKVYTNTTAGASGNTAWNVTNCPSTGSCLISVAFQNGGGDSISAPFYVYDGTDTIYVGDSSGHLHKFTGVFYGTPGEVTTGGWPITVSTHVLTSPVYDSGTSTNVFVADSGGYLYSYDGPTAAHQMTSSKLTNASNTVGIVDGPLIDSTTEEVYVFVGDDANTSTSLACTSSGGCSGVFQFAAGNTTTGTGACNATSTTSWGTGTNCGVESLFGQGANATMYDGAFDHIYNVGTGTTGYLWACAPQVNGYSRLSRVTFQSTGSIVSGTSIYSIYPSIVTITNAASTCSPVTEIWGGGGGTNDYVFLSVTAGGTLTTSTPSALCTGACLYNFIVGTGGTDTTAGTAATPSTATAGIAEAGGTSGIVVDNVSSGSGESQIYFTGLSSQTCAGNGTTGSGTGGCAIQTSQTVP